MREQLRFAVLGPVSAWRGTTEVDLGPPQQRAVLAVLLLAEGAQVRVGQLVDALWGPEPPPSAVGSIRTYVHRLRQRLEPSVIRSLGDGYVVPVAPDVLDLTRFRDLLGQAERTRRAGDAQGAAALLRDALGLWRGTALTGIRGAYAGAQRERLGTLRLSALEARLAVELDVGGHAEAATELAGLVAEHPLDERFREMLMLALYRSGRQSAALETYRETQALLADELGVDPGPGLQRLYERILRADAGLLAPPPPEPGPVPAEPAPVPVAPVPAQLPAALAAFVGRDAQLAEADALLPQEGEPSATVLIGGTAGVGKTTFAVHWARRVAARFPDGQLHVNLRGFDPVGVPVSPEQALCTVLEALGVAPRDLPQDVDALAARYRTALASRRVLILLDNARDAGQVRPLLPGTPGCLVVVTSRNHLGGLVAVDGAHPVRLDVLTAREAHDLLARRLGRTRVEAEREAVAEIVERCARLPLALAVTAARAANRPAFPLAALAAELRAGHGSLDAFTDTDTAADVRAVLSSSYHAVTPEAARLFRLLALHPGPDVSLPATASLAGLDAARTRRLLDDLVHAQLLDEPAPGRYSSHDLLRAYATELADGADTPGELRAAHRRMFDHYLHSAHAAAEAASLTRDRIDLVPAAEKVTGERFTDSEGSSAWFAAERTVLVATLRQARREGYHAHAWQLAWCVEQYLGRQGLWHELTVTLRTALASAERLGDPTARAHVHRGLAQAQKYARHIDDAREHIERAIELFAEVGNAQSRAECHRQLSTVLEVQGDIEGALEQTRRCLEVLGPTGDSRLRSWALNGLGWYHTLLGQHREALPFCRAALRLARGDDDSYTLAHVLNSTGHAHHSLGEYDEAVAAFEEALGHFRRIGGVPWAQAHTLSGLAETRLSLGDTEAAQVLLTEALEILDGLAHPDAAAVRVRLDALRGEGTRPFTTPRPGR